MAPTAVSLRSFFGEWPGPWYLRMTKIWIIIEMAFTLSAVGVLIGAAAHQFHDIHLPLFALIIAHLGTALLLIKLFHRIMSNRTLSFLRGWWLILSIALDVYSVVVIYTATFTTGDHWDIGLKVLSMAALFISGTTLIPFIAAVMSYSPEEGHSVDMGSELPGNNYVSVSDAAVVTMRYPVAGTVGGGVSKFVHQPARKGD